MSQTNLKMGIVFDEGSAEEKSQTCLKMDMDFDEGLTEENKPVLKGA